ncbi:MAG TPA: AI-2E family transporter [Polyangiaceae bacterium]|jgi:predicted PurR-regulated permease PerM|nr:AI-2E family transporter [Polyangiaceae bacterium]
MLRSVRNPLWSAAALFIVVQGMREASDILMPITVAAMMAISCSPAVRWLRQRRVPNVLAVLAVVFGIMVVLTGLGALVGASLAGFKDSLPAYRERLTSLFEGTVAWLEAHGVRVNRAELLGTADLQRATGAAAGYLVDSVTKLGGVISNTFLVVFTMILILFEGSTVPGRLRALAGNPDGDISQYARIATDVQRYLGIKTVVSGANGVCIGAWCAVMGVDFPLLWGLVGFLLNYIPNIGFILAAMPAVLLALIQHGLGTAVVLAAGYGVIGTVIGNFIEPMWLGRKLDLSVTVVFVSLVAWNWVWGPVGMLLSVPLTMIIKIMLEQSREYSFIAALLDSGEEEAARRSLTSTVPARASVTSTLPPRTSSIPPRGFSDPVLAARPDTLRPPPMGEDGDR